MKKIDNLEILIVGGGNDFENMKTAADNVNNKLNETFNQIYWKQNRHKISWLPAANIL